MTGTFDGWSKSEQLDKVGDYFEKTVTLPDFTEKVYYKVGDASVWSSPPIPQRPPFANSFCARCAAQCWPRCCSGLVRGGWGMTYTRCW